MTTYTQTPNFKVPIPNRDRRFWHDLYKDGMMIFDSLLAKYIAVNQFQGVWEHSTAYTAGQTVVDGDTGGLYQCMASHTSAATGTFAEDRTDNPTFWTDVSFLVRFRGTWANSIAYNYGDFVVSGHIYAVCVETHTSTATGTIDDANNASKWSFLIDASDTVDEINNQLFRQVQIISGAHTITNSDKNNLLIYNGAGHTWDIDATGVSDAFECVILNYGNGGLTIDPAGSQTVDLASTFVLDGRSSCILTRVSASEFATISRTYQQYTAGYVLAAPAGAYGNVTMRRLVTADLPYATVTSKSGAYVITAADHNGIIVQTAAGTLSLPTGVDSGFFVTVLNRHTASIDVDTNGAETIDGDASVTVLSGSGASFVFDGSNYRQVSTGGGGGGYAMAILFGA